MNSHPLIRKRKRERFVGHPPNLHYPHGFFDEASKNNIGGVGIVLEIIQSHSFSLKLGCGSNTNSRVELLALWTLLFFAAEIGIPSLHIFGDSSVVINWENEKATLSGLELEGWCEKISSLKSSFHSLEIQHVYHEHNQKVVCLSKEPLNLATRLLSFTEFYEGHIIGGGETHIF